MPVHTATDASQLRDEGESIRAAVAKSGFCLVRGLVDPAIARQAVTRVHNAFAEAPIAPSGLGSRESVRRNSAKWSIGGFSPSQSGVSRLMATFYNPMAQPDLFGLREAFRTLIEVRDLVSGLEKSLQDEYLENGAFNATRVQMYPSGGGFMSAHSDSTAASILSAQRDGCFLQPVLLISQRGLDYESGGAFVIDKDGQSVDVELGSQSGDIIIYDERTVHGVADVDTHVPPNVALTRGRIVGLASVYQ